MDAGVRLGRRLDDRLFILLGLDAKKFSACRLLGEALLVDERRIFLFLRFGFFSSVGVGTGGFSPRCRALS